MKFSKEEEAKIVSAIQAAELKTSGEIRVHVAKNCKKSVFEEATATFENLGMTKTAERNGILIFLCEKKREFVVLGDSGIHEKVGKDFWDRVRDSIADDFKRGDFLKGLMDGVTTCGEQLSRYFPRKADDQNELSDQITHS